MRKKLPEPQTHAESIPNHEPINDDNNVIEDSQLPILNPDEITEILDNIENPTQPRR